MDNNEINAFATSGGHIFVTRGLVNADNTAMSLMASAGYSPSGLIEMLRSLSGVQTSGAGFGKTHPSPAQRITNAEKSVGKYSVANTSASRNARFTAVK